MGSKRKAPVDKTPRGFGDILEKKGLPATSPHTEQVTFQEAVPGSEGKTLLIKNAFHCTPSIYCQLERELSDPAHGAAHTLSGGLIQADSLDKLALATYPTGAVHCLLSTAYQVVHALGMEVITKFGHVNPPETGATIKRPASHGKELAGKEVKIRPQKLHFDELQQDVEGRVILLASVKPGGAQVEQLLADGSTLLIKWKLPPGSAYAVTADLLQGLLDGWGRLGPTGGQGNSFSLVLSITFQHAPVKLGRTPLTSSVSSTIKPSVYMTPMVAITTAQDERAGPDAAFVPPRQKNKSLGAAVQAKMERLLGFKGCKPPQYTWEELGEMDYEDALKLCMEEAARRGAIWYSMPGSGAMVPAGTAGSIKHTTGGHSVKVRRTGKAEKERLVAQGLDEEDAQEKAFSYAQSRKGTIGHEGKGNKGHMGNPSICLLCSAVATKKNDTIRTIIICHKQGSCPSKQQGKNWGMAEVGFNNKMTASNFFAKHQ